MESNSSKIWFIETGNRTQCISGGGLCVSANGLILTVAHLLAVPGVRQNTLVHEGRSGTGTEMKKLKVVGKSPNFDLALLQVVPDKEGEGEVEVFEFFDIGNGDSSVEVDINEGVMAYVHQNHSPFTEKEGITCYPFPPNVGDSFPKFSDQSTVQSSGFLTLAQRTDEAYKTVEIVTDQRDQAFLDLHPKLPLIQVAGFGDEAGSSGCPFFKKDGTLLGLCFISKHGFQYLLPADLLNTFVHQILSRSEEVR